MNEERCSNVEHFRSLAQSIGDLYARKNADYGDSFGASVRKYGLVAALTRISDKFNRLENLICNGGGWVSDESLGDTLLDLASYAIMTKMALEKGDYRLPGGTKPRTVAIPDVAVTDPEEAGPRRADNQEMSVKSDGSVTVGGIEIITFDEEGRVRCR
jgi:hypothetical protein